MKQRFFLLFLCACLRAHAQDEAATSAPIMNPFNLKGDDLGAIASYVNQLTGEAVFPLNLVSIPGPGGLGINVMIGYNSSNIENFVKTWNQEAPTGVLGLGWNMDMPLIMVDNKQTCARDDDEFYLVEGGRSIRLVCVGINSGLYSYRTSTYTNWKISYTPSTEKWEVVKDDGSRFIYGDTQGTASSVQWTACWGNWMGNSVASGQQLQAMIWNLREVRTAWGDRVTYAYLVGNISAGFGTLATEYSLLYKINDSWGHEVEFVPGQKTTNEYQHLQWSILKRSERFFISKILVRTNGVLDYEQQFSYSTNELGTGQLSKRLLKSINKVSPVGTIESTLSFEYRSTIEFHTGDLEKVILPTGGSIIFTYSAGGYFNPKQVATTTTAPSGYADPDVYISEDYALVTWRQLNGSFHDEDPRQTLATLLDWRGKWRSTSLGSIGYTKLFVDNEQFWDLFYATILGPNQVVHGNDSRVVLEKDFFATMTYAGGNGFLLNMWRRNGLSDGWQHSGQTLDMGTGANSDRVKLLAGNNFVCASSNNGRLFLFVWDGNSWRQSTINETPGERWTTATNNYVLSHDPAPNPDVVRLYYLDQLMNWQTRTQTVTGFNSVVVDNEDEGERMVWYPSNSSAFVMANGTNEMIIQWDANYNNIVRVDPGLHYGDNSKVYFDGTTLGLVTQLDDDDNGVNRALRRSGSNWHDSGEKANTFGYQVENEQYNFGMAAFGPDLMVWNSDIPAPTWDFKYQVFDPASSQWLSEVQISNNDNQHVNVGPGYFTIGRKIYMHTTSGYSLASNQYLSGNDDVFPSSRRFIASASRIIWLWNGDVQEYQHSGGKYRVRNSTTLPYRYMAGSSIYAKCTTGFENQFVHGGAQGGHLHLWALRD